MQALSLVESHDLLEDRRTELRHTKLYPIAFPYLYSSCTRDICKISTFSNFQMFGWIKSKVFVLPHIMTSYCVSITEQATAKSYLFVKYCIYQDQY
jgi:hypothetical protein